MHTSNEYLTYKGVTGTVKYYRGPRGVQQLLDDLNFAQTHHVTLIITLGSVDPNTHIDGNQINMSAVLQN